MRTAITVTALAVGLWLAADAASLAAPSRHPGGMNALLMDGSVRFGLAPGAVTIELEQRGELLHGTVAQTIDQPVTFTATVQAARFGGSSPDCLGDWPGGWNQGRAEIEEKEDGSAELRVYHPRAAGCVLVGKLAARQPSGAGNASVPSRVGSSGAKGAPWRALS